MNNYHKKLKFLLLHPDKIITDVQEISCFSNVLGYYLSNELAKHVDVTNVVVSTKTSNDELGIWFDNLDVDGYDAILGLGLRYFSTIPKDIVKKLKQRVYPSLLCQIYDGSRLDTDNIDITFTIKNDDLDPKYCHGATASRYIRHRAFNEYIGWAADSKLNTPAQEGGALHILVDHTNYGKNPIDSTVDVVNQVKEFYNSRIWRDRWNSVILRRFDSGKISNIDPTINEVIKKYDRTSLPYTEVCAEHCKTHVFLVTHPESVGLVVLETATAGALVVTPKGYIPNDRLQTVRHIEYEDSINWQTVLDNIDVAASRKIAIENSWETVAKRIRDGVRIRQLIRGQQDD